IYPPSDLELYYAQFLEDDKNNSVENNFGLHAMLLSNYNFLKEFEQFCICENLKIYEFPKLYDFVKNHIYFIIIHQQQVEGLFNKLDLKTHANMSELMKESKLRLSSNKISKENLTDELNEIRKLRNQAKQYPLQDAQPQLFGPDIASNLFKQILY
ncbi:12503_t:CDS:1, partial [Ambispora leptoticha]